MDVQNQPNEASRYTSADGLVNDVSRNIVTIDGDVCVSAIISQLNNLAPSRNHNESTSDSDSDSSDLDCNCIECNHSNGIYMDYLINFLEWNGISPNVEEGDFKDLYMRLLNNIYGMSVEEAIIEPPRPNISRQNTTAETSINSSVSSSPRNINGRTDIRPRDPSIMYSDSDSESGELFDYYDEPKTADAETLNNLKKSSLSYSEVRKKLNNKHFAEDCTFCITNVKPKYGTYKVKQYIILNCKHVFHYNCIIPYLEKYGNTCPNCREPVA